MAQFQKIGIWKYGSRIRFGLGCAGVWDSLGIQLRINWEMKVVMILMTFTEDPMINRDCTGTSRSKS